MYMTDEEALKACEEMIASCKRGPVEELNPGFLAAAKAALEAKISAKKPKRPTLEEMETACRAAGMLRRFDYSNILDAADIIKAVREEVIPWLKASVAGCMPRGPKFSLPRTDAAPRLHIYSIDLLYALGEEP